MDNNFFSLYKCPKCGEHNSPDSIYCGECGTKLIKTCFHCSSKIPVKSKYCNICGSRYEEPKAEIQVEVPAHVFTMPTPKEEGGYLIDTRDQQKYKMVKIGNQVWLAENFRFSAQNSFAYDGKNDHVDSYGRLYTWESALKCVPTGWRLPTRKDFKELMHYCKSLGKGDVGTMLKSPRNSRHRRRRILRQAFREQDQLRRIRIPGFLRVLLVRRRRERISRLLQAPELLHRHLPGTDLQEGLRLQR